MQRSVSGIARRATPDFEKHSSSGNGAIAQLGERVLCKHEVVGSIPSGSTIPAIADDRFAVPFGDLR